MMLRLSAAGTPAWKVGLIPVLLAVLFKVTRNAPPEVDPAPAALEEVLEAGAQAPSVLAAAALPELTLNDALKFDPFASLPLPERVEDRPVSVLQPPVAETAPEPPPPMAPVVDRVAERAATLKQLTVSAVIRSAKGSVAIIDSKPVREGDYLSPGVRVVQIRETDVILRVENGEAGPSASGAESINR